MTRPLQTVCHRDVSSEVANQALHQKAVGANKLCAHVAYFTGYIPPYALPVLQSVNERVERLSILLSTPMESNRNWEAEWGQLDVHVQRTFTRRSEWKHHAGFSDVNETHWPLDTWKQLRGLRPDVIVTEEMGFRSLMCSLYQCWQYRIPLVLICNLSEHTERGRGRVRQLLRRWFAARAWVTTVNGGSGRRYLESVGFRSDSIHDFPYTAVPGVFDALPLSRTDTGTRRLVYCGGLSERKGIAPWLKTLVKYCESHREQLVELQIYGDGDMSEVVNATVCPHNLSICLQGFQDYEVLKQAFSEAEILVFPTLADEWGLVVNEALAGGLPVLGSIQSQAVEELICEGRNGWRFDATQSNSVWNAMNKALNTSYESLERMRPHCRDSVQERTPRWAADKLITAIDSALQMRKAGSRHA